VEHRNLLRVVIRTDRLVLREPCAGDEQDLKTLENDERVAGMTLGRTLPYTREDARRWIAAAARGREEGNSLELVVESKEMASFVGVAGLVRISRADDNAELGYRLQPGWRGRGIAVEAARAMLGFAFEELGLERVYAYCFPDNFASQKVLLRCGLRYEGRLAHSAKKGGEYKDLLVFGTIRDQWAEEAEELLRTC